MWKLKLHVFNFKNNNFCTDFVTDVKIIIANIEFKCHEIYNICWNLSDY